MNLTLWNYINIDVWIKCKEYYPKILIITHGDYEGIEVVNAIDWLLDK